MALIIESKNQSARRTHLSHQYFKWGGRTKGVGRVPTLAWPDWKQPDIPVEVDTDRL